MGQFIKDIKTTRVYLRRVQVWIPKKKCYLTYFSSPGTKEIDIAATLEHLRDQRPQMVKTKVSV